MSTERLSERLEIIKFLRESEKTVAPGMQPSELISRKDVDWLINRVEELINRVEELEQQNENYREVIKECVERMNAVRDFEKSIGGD